MKALIEIDEKTLKALHEFVVINTGRSNGKTIIYKCLKAISNGTPITNNATNGDVIKAMFGGMQINDPENENDLVYIEHLYFGFPKYWWDAPYKGGE